MTSQETSPTPFTERDFRDAMGSFATGICVVTVNDNDGRAIGMTVNSFSSVSLDPPLVLVCLGTEAARSDVIVGAKAFNISMLSENQLETSNHFARPGEGVAEIAMVSPGLNTAPILNQAAAVIECDVEAQYPGGDHIILVGRVTHLHADTQQSPLLYFRGQYRKLDGEV